MFKKEPWPLNKKATKGKKATKKVVTKKVSKVTKIKKAKETKDLVKKVTNSLNQKFYKDNIEVSTQKVFKLFSQHKENFYSNKDIMKELNLSEGTVSGITNRLQALGYIKISKVTEHMGQIFQHVDGSGVNTEKVRGDADTSVLVKELFENNKNRVFTKADITKELPNRSKGQIVQSIRILLLCKEIKLLDDFENGVLKFQSKFGNKAGLDVKAELDEGYTTFNSFLRESKYTGNKESFKKHLPKTCVVFYSAGGVTPMYSIKELEKCAKKAQKKGFFDRLWKNKGE